MSNPKTTTITVSYEVWEELNRRKKVGESFDHILRRILLIKER